MTLDKHKKHNISTRKTFSVRIDNDIATELNNQNINLTSLVNELLRKALFCNNVITKDDKRASLMKRYNAKDPTLTANELDFLFPDDY